MGLRDPQSDYMYLGTYHCSKLRIYEYFNLTQGLFVRQSGYNMI